MKTLDKNCLSVLTLIVFLLIGIASSPKNGSYNDGAKWIPKDFDPNNTILLIAKHPRDEKQNNRMIKFLDAHYPYKFEVVDETFIRNKVGRWADTNTYRFGILWEVKTSSNIGLNIYGRFMDRSTGEIFSETGNARAYGQISYRAFFNTITNRFK